MSEPVPANRIRLANDEAVRGEGEYVLYWMTAFRRTSYNFALQHACDLAASLQRPLLILEGLQINYRWACRRFHQFVIEGMRDNATACRSAGVAYYPYVEPNKGAGKHLVEELANQACAVVADDFPCFFLPRMHRTIARKLPVQMSMVDSNCLMPLSVADRTFTVAHSYRRWMQKTLPTHLADLPLEAPLQFHTKSKRYQVPKSIKTRWPEADLEHLLNGGLDQLAIDQNVTTTSSRGGAAAAGDLLNTFLGERFDAYDVDRNEPNRDGSSELSAHLHFGHVSSHEVFLRVMDSQAWNPSKLQKVNGKVNGFWGVDENAEAFLDQLCTWREIGFNMSFRESDFASYGSLPEWAQKTLDDHRQDPREFQYSLEQFEQAETHDEIWNAAQRQLIREGRIHNYLRMLWGKKILHWSESPETALEIMIELNNKFALDGRNPNSYSGIFWVLGRYDRAWGPERPIFGKIRYMTSENTARKHKLDQYLKKFAR